MSEENPEYRGNGFHKWEGVTSDAGHATQRLRVPGGWLYRDMKTSTMVFVKMVPSSMV